MSHQSTPRKQQIITRNIFSEPRAQFFCDKSFCHETGIHGPPDFENFLARSDREFRNFVPGDLVVDESVWSVNSRTGNVFRKPERTESVLIDRS